MPRGESVMIHVAQGGSAHEVRPLSAAFLADLLVRSPRKFIYFHYLKKYFLDQSIQKYFI